jgi:hypothetical protein
VFAARQVNGRSVEFVDAGATTLDPASLVLDAGAGAVGGAQRAVGVGRGEDAGSLREIHDQSISVRAAPARLREGPDRAGRRQRGGWRARGREVECVKPTWGLRMGLEELWYEISPYFYVLGGLLIIVALPGIWPPICGALLMFAGATILRMRWSYRKRLADASDALAKASQRAAGAGDETTS